MTLFSILLASTILLCSLVAGFLYGFALIAMPGLGALSDQAFIKAFQEMDQIIQDGHPLFILVWVGSVVLVVGTAFVGFFQLQGGALLLLITAVLIYLIGVQLPTATINIPLNNQIQAFDADGESDAACQVARANFEPRWNQWNGRRTVLAILSSALFIIVLALI